MANKNQNVVLALFEREADAQAAAESLMAWDDANNDIKLGGIGMMGLNDKGEITLKKVGARSTSTGAKAGIALGAVAGVLSGGITLIGGVLAGWVGGALLGSLRHKGLSFSDEQRAELTDALKAGKVGLAVMADDFEVEPTQVMLKTMGGSVVTIAATAEALAEAEKAAEANPDLAKMAENANIGAEQASAARAIAGAPSPIVGDVSAMNFVGPGTDPG